MFYQVIQSVAGGLNVVVFGSGCQWALVEEMSLGGETIACFVSGDVELWLSTFICAATVNSRQIARPPPLVGHVSRCLSPTWIASSLTNHKTWPWNQAAVSKDSLQADFIFDFWGHCHEKKIVQFVCAYWNSPPFLPFFLPSASLSQISVQRFLQYVWLVPSTPVPSISTVGFVLRLLGRCIEKSQIVCRVLGDCLSGLTVGEIATSVLFRSACCFCFGLSGEGAWSLKSSVYLFKEPAKVVKWHLWLMGLWDLDACVVVNIWLLIKSFPGPVFLLQDVCTC